eukprot:CAMPEP_0195077702 /NCGR_PEP_ID=MMETSP0448-20130528/20069_1 /TAXON_ID=66468 /ORGANISM="Heterocapsa triquestra, Strain CCMP 448" /LENGTH=39 /DNA_ID= /DNA_START= /DNA_END= /DNA_ORIENTATION=
MNVVAPSFAVNCYELEELNLMDATWPDFQELCAIVVLTW